MRLLIQDRCSGPWGLLSFELEMKHNTQSYLDLNISIEATAIVFKEVYCRTEQP